MTEAIVKALFWIGYAVAAAGVGCLVVPVGTFGVPAGITFGLVMGLFVWLASLADTRAHKLIRPDKTWSIGWQLLAVGLIYVVLPAGGIGILHLIVPSLIVFGGGFWALIGLVWVPLFLASLLNFRQRIRL
jgi:hypothetical protein